MGFDESYPAGMAPPRGCPLPCDSRAPRSMLPSVVQRRSEPLARRCPVSLSVVPPRSASRNVAQFRSAPFSVAQHRPVSFRKRRLAQRRSTSVIAALRRPPSLNVTRRRSELFCVLLCVLRVVQCRAATLCFARDRSVSFTAQRPPLHRSVRAVCVSFCTTETVEAPQPRRIGLRQRQASTEDRRPAFPVCGRNHKLT